jgi:hypothetical protein
MGTDPKLGVHGHRLNGCSSMRWRPYFAFARTTNLMRLPCGEATVHASRRFLHTALKKSILLTS